MTNAQPSTPDMFPTDEPVTESSAVPVAIEGELLDLAEKNPVAIFTGQNLTEFLEKYEEDVKSVDHDVSTVKGRDELKSFAFKIVKKRTGLVAAANSLTEDMKAQVKTINSERDRAIKELERIEQEVRQPLTDFENRDKNRVKHHNDALEALRGLFKLPIDATQEMMQQRITEVENHQRVWEEFEDAAADVRNHGLNELRYKLRCKKQADDDAAELEQFRESERVRIKAESDKAIADKAAADATKAANEKAEKDRQALEAQNKIDLIWEQAHRDDAEFNQKRETERAKQAEIDAQAQKERAEAAEWAALVNQAEAENRAFDADIALKESQRREKEHREWAQVHADAHAENAAFDARKKAEADQQRADDAKAEEERQRAADKEHARKVNGEALADMKAAMDNPDSKEEDPLKRLIQAIILDKIRHITIQY